MATISTQTIPVAPRVPPTRVRPGVSKNVIYSTYQHVLESYGSQMPVLVAESLNYTPGARDNASVNINPDIAWAWYVFGRRLLVWHIPSFTDTTLPVMAREMLLPSSDLAHNANLVYIFSGPNEKSPSCLAVSPEGLIRYWVVLGHHTTWIDVNANLGGEEVCGIHYVPPLGCLAVTTSGTMIILTPVFNYNSADVTITRITPVFGWIDSIGKTVSSLLFGSQSQRLEMRTVKVLTSQKVKTHWHIFLLAGFTLQSWTVEIETSISALIYETNIEQIIRWAFPHQIRDDAENEIQITDIRHSEADSIIVLAASDDPRYYIIVELDGNDLTPPTFAIRLCIISKNDVNFLENVTGDLSSLRFLLLPAEALVFSKLVIYAIPFSGGEECDGEPLDLPGGVVLGGIMHKRTPIFFSATFGFVSITPVNTSSIDVLNTSVSETSCIPSTVTEREPVTSTTMNDITNLKIAFVHFVRKNYKRCLKVISEEFPVSNKATPVDSVLSTTLVKVSLDIINDLSPKDHRWRGEVTNGSNLYGKISSHLDSQLVEKLKAHDVFLEFARKLATVIDLGKVTKVGNTVKTIYVLYEHNEKISAAFSLKKLQRTYEKTVKDAVVDVAHELNFDYINIGDVDFFYRYASISDAAIKRIINICIENVGDYTTNYDYIDLLKETNDVINSVLGTLISRKCRKGYYIDTAYHPWLSAPPPGLFDDIVALVKLNFDIIKSWGNQLFKLKSILLQFYTLCNHLLFLRMPYVPKEEFDNLSSSFIQFFIEKEMLYEALRLAYKYKNFDYLAALTYQLHQEKDISDYINEFGSEGFCLCLFEYLYSAQKYKDLLNLSLPEELESQFKEFISDKLALKLVYYLKQNDLASANETLLSLFDDEKISIRDQEIICLYSIIICCAGCLNEDSKALGLLKKIQLQQSIPEELFIQKGYDPESIRLLSLEEIIDVYIDGEFDENKELFFLKSLEVIDLMDDPTAKDLMRMNIWATVISQDSWEGYESDFPAEICEEFLTFRLMKLLKTNGKEVSALKVPTVDEIILGELLEDDKRVDVLKKNLQSRHIYQYWYDQIVGTEESSSYEKSNVPVFYNGNGDGEESDDETTYEDFENET